MDRSLLRQLLAVVALGVALGAPSRAPAADEPAATQTPAKTKPGCCCYKNDKMPDGWACTWGWQESRCKTVAADLKKVKLSDGEYRWNEGRCPPSGTPK
jgi:hypothetical protein